MSNSDEEFVTGIHRKLEDTIKQMNNNTDADNNTDSAQVLDLLKILSKTKMSLQILKNTKIGFTVNALRKSSQNKDVMSMTKSLVLAWKKFLPNSKKKSSENKENAQKHKSYSAATDPENNEKAGANDIRDGEKAVLQTSPPKPTVTTDDDRLRCRKMLANALSGDGVDGIDGIVSSPEELASFIEDKIFEINKETSPKYKAKVRSCVFNLKDKKNPSLRENVLCGTIKPEKIAVMTSEEMASDKIKKLREQFIKEGVEASQLAIKEGTLTTQLKCAKCKKNNCTFHEMQTRSADEPMTVFVFCNECGNRWKQ